MSPSRFLAASLRQIRRLRRPLSALLLGTSLAVAAQGAQAPSPQQVRAALVFNFLKFTEWPRHGEPRLTLCNAADDPKLASALDALSGRSVRDLHVEAVHYDPQRHCDVIVVESRQRWLALAERHARRGVLTIGGYGGFLDDGGMVELSIDSGSPRFDINLSTARSAELRFYPQLLRLARRIVE